MDRRPWGRIESPEGEGSLDLVIVNPGEEIPLHYHEKMLEVHVILNGKDKGKVNVLKPGNAHSYKNDGQEELKILCLCVPPFNDKKDVKK
ncbi:hypothetical protein K8R43_00255 [archaeon]|nr:hypothetical protein [archaeon]